MEEEKKIDLSVYNLQSNLIKRFQEYFNWWEMLSLREVKGNIPQTRIRNSQMEQHYGLVLEKIESATPNQLNYILGQKEKDILLQMMKTLSIEEYVYVKDQEKSSYI